MTKLETRLAEFFDGTLQDAEAKVLARELELNPEAVQEFIGNYRVDRLLKAKFQPTSAETVDAVMLQVRHENHPFVQSVLRNVRALPPRTTFVEWFREWTGRWRGVLRWTLASAAIVVLALLWVWLFGPITGAPIIAAATGDGVTLERTGQTFPATVGTRVQAGDVLRTGTNAGASIAFGAEHTRLELRESTQFKLASLVHGKRFDLNAGKIEATVARQRPFKSMVITTPQAEVRVLGTRFSLNVTSNATRLEVAEGKVRFTRTADGAEVKVAAGTYAVAAGNYELLAQPMTGSILREYWTNLPGDFYITVLTTHPSFPDNPSGRQYLNSFEAPSHWGHDYGARIRGYLHPPRTGDYTFWIAAADEAQLFLSPDETPENRQQSAYADGTEAHEWTKQRNQQSSTVTLFAGRKYYLEVLHKVGQHEDHLAVAWQGPGREREVIPGEFLSPAEAKHQRERKP